MSDRSQTLFGQIDVRRLSDFGRLRQMVSKNVRIWSDRSDQCQITGQMAVIIPPLSGFFFFFFVVVGVCFLVLGVLFFEGAEFRARQICSFLLPTIW